MEEQATAFMPIQAQQPRVYSPPANRYLPAFRGLATTQLLVGTSTIIIGIASVGALSQRYWLTSVGGGIWGGIFIVVTGIIGISSLRNLSSVVLNGIYMTFCIISSVISFFDGILFTVGIMHYSYCDDSFEMSDWNFNSGSNCYSDRGRGIALYVPLVILMIIEFFVSIIAAVYACKNCNCCCIQQRQGVVMMQQYQVVASSQGQTAVYPVATCPPPNYNIGVAGGQVTTHPTTVPGSSGYPQQQMEIVSYPSQIVSQPVGGLYVSTPGQQTNVTYSAQPPPYSMVPPPYNGASAIEPPPYSK